MFDNQSLNSIFTVCFIVSKSLQNMAARVAKIKGIALAKTSEMLMLD